MRVAATRRHDDDGVDDMSAERTHVHRISVKLKRTHFRTPLVKAFAIGGRREDAAVLINMRLHAAALGPLSCTSAGACGVRPEKQITLKSAATRMSRNNLPA